MTKIVKIMLVDDDAKVITVFEKILRKKGYRVVSAMNGQQALEMLPKDPPDLIIMDLLMPTMHGFEVIKKIKADSALSNIPIIAATAVYKGAMNRMEAIRAGADDFIEKPVAAELLLEKIKHFVF